MTTKAIVKERCEPFLSPEEGDLLIAKHQHGSEKRIIVMYEKETGSGNFAGTVIANPKSHRPIGHHRTDWINECFDMFYGTITLER